MTQPADTIRNKWLIVNGVPTCLQICGGWTIDEIQGNTIIIVVTGNPGITDFYIPFIKCLHEKCDGISVWAIGHAGHMYHDKCPSLEDNPSLYDLEGQIKHKKEFITTYVPKGKKIILIGHSIGAKICIELMKVELISGIVEQTHLICPCLENISSTPNGIRFQEYDVHFYPLLVRFSKLLSFIPFAVIFFFLKLFIMLVLKTTQIDDSIVHGMVKIFETGVINQGLFLGKDEMIKVKELDSEVYEKWGSKIFSYYGQRDRWSPLSHYENMKKMHPKVNSKVLDEKFKHAFMIRHSCDMAEELVDPVRQLFK